MTLPKLTRSKLGLPAVTQENIDALAKVLCRFDLKDTDKHFETIEIGVNGRDLYPPVFSPHGSLRRPRWMTYQNRAMCQLVAYAVMETSR